MTTALDREVRKALVRLAEQQADYRQAARVILLLDAGRDDQQISTALKISTQAAADWRKRYAKEGLAILSGALPPEMIGDVPEPEPDVDKEEPSAPVDELDIEPEDVPNTLSELSISVSEEPSLFDGLPELPEVVRPSRNAPIQQMAETVSVNDPMPAPSAPPKPQNMLPDDAPDPSQEVSIGALAVGFDIDMSRARHISRQIRELYDVTINAHRLAPHFRHLLHACAMLHGIALNIDSGNFPQLGREIIGKYQIKELTIDERNLIATVIGLQHPNAIIPQDMAFQALPSELQQPAEVMVAFLRMAIGLDASRSQKSFIIESHEVPGEITLVIGGDSTSIDAEAAQNASQLWNNMFSMLHLRFITDTQAETDVDVDDLPDWVTLSEYDYSIEVSNKLRQHHTKRFEYVADRIRRNDSGLLVPFWREFQRIIGVWNWLLPGSKPRQVFNEDTDWLESLIDDALFFATLEDRSYGLVNETDPSEDDPTAVRDLKTMAIYHADEAAKAFDALRDALRSRRYDRWLGSVQSLQFDNADTLTFGSQVGVRAWAYLGELRAIIDHVNAAGMNADFEELLTLDLMQSFETDLRHLTDLLRYSISLLGSEIQQVLQVLEPLADYVQAWHRMERVAQFAEQQQHAPPINVSPFVAQAYAVIMRERANELRWGLANMWETIDNASFRRALALAVAKP